MMIDQQQDIEKNGSFVKKEQTLVKLGHCNFTKRFFDKSLPTLSSNLKELPHKYIWRLAINNQSIHFIQELRSTKCRNFHPYFYISSPPLKEQLLIMISCISFGSLKSIHLNSCRIQSIQIISFLSMQKLSELHLIKNFITNAKSFNKTNWVKLKSISMKHNSLQQINLSRARFNALKHIFYEQNDIGQRLNANDIKSMKISSYQMRILGKYTFWNNESFGGDKIPRIIDKRFYMKKGTKQGND